jgi:hypothetical protein
VFRIYGNSVCLRVATIGDFTSQLPAALDMAYDFNINEFLTQPLMAHLAIGSPDGARESPVWFLWEEGSVWLVGNSRDTFPQRIRQDPRCAIGTVQFNADSGVLRHVGIRGVAEILPLNEDRLRGLLRRYLGEDEARRDPCFRRNIMEGLDLMVRVIPGTIVAREQSYFKHTRTRRQ